MANTTLATLKINCLRRSHHYNSGDQTLLELAGSLINDVLGERQSYPDIVQQEDQQKAYAKLKELFLHNSHGLGSEEEARVDVDRAQPYEDQEKGLVNIVYVEINDHVGVGVVSTRLRIKGGLSLTDLI